MRSITHEGHTSEHAETVKDARKLARRAKRCAVWVPISRDDGIEVEASCAAILRALHGMPGGDACGGIYWPEHGTFRLDTCG